MSMSDTAEYWADVKAHRPIYSGKNFKHIPDKKCSHYKPITGNTSTTPYIDDINCYECIERIKNGFRDGLIEGKAHETYYMSNRERKAFNSAKVFNEKYGKCSCGSHWTIRINKTNNKEFLGCSNYPHCKNTKTITNRPTA